MASQAQEMVTSAAPRATSYRWTICALLLAATTINYMDRQVLGLLAPTLSRELGWSESDYGAITSWFSFAYAIGFLRAGPLIDRPRPKPRHTRGLTQPTGRRPPAPPPP